MIWDILNLYVLVESGDFLKITRRTFFQQQEFRVMLPLARVWHFPFLGNQFAGLQPWVVYHPPYDQCYLGSIEKASNFP